MLKFISKLWWSVVLRGILFLAFGVIAITSQMILPETLISYLGFMEAALGIIVIIASASLRKSISNWFMLVFISLLDIALGVYIIMNSQLAAEYFTLIIAFWALLMGIAQFALAIRPSVLRIFLVINGLLAVTFAAVIYLNPFAGSDMLNKTIGFFTILFSIFLIYIGIKMRFLGKLKADEISTPVEDNKI